MNTINRGSFNDDLAFRMSQQSTIPSKPTAASASAFTSTSGGVGNAAGGDNPALRKAFDQFVGQTFYGAMLKEMRKSQGKVPYMNGGQAEQIFTQQLDQMLTKKMSDTSASTLSGPMYKLFTQSQK